MSKKEGYTTVLVGLLNEFLRTGYGEELMEYLVSNSNLPGPRGNLELAESFTDVLEDHVEEGSEKLWNLCTKLTGFSPLEAPVNNPKEFLVFCGVHGMGAFGSSAAFYQKALSRLNELASDPRWRTREGVAMAIQRLIKKKREETLKQIDGWIGKENWLVIRAVAAGVAEPPILKDKQTAKSALELHKKIFARILAAEERKSDEFKTLRKALGYSLSVVICAIPKEGFIFMRQIIDSQDADVLWVVKENLKKNRLVRNFPDEVATIKKCLWPSCYSVSVNV